VGIWAVVVLLVLAAAALAILQPDRSAAEVDASYRTNQSHFAELPDGTRMHYLEAGSPDATTLLLVHGSFDSAFTWERVMPNLIDDFHVVAPDLPAHGLTGRTVRDTYAMSDLVDAVHDLVGVLGLSRFHLAGNSMGGNVAWCYALAYPHQVERLILIDSAGYPHESAPLVDHQVGPIMRWLYRHGNPTLAIRRGLQRAVADPSSVTPAYVTRSVDLVRREGSRDALAERNRHRNIERQPVERIAEIAVPTLLVWGKDDAVQPISCAHRFHAALPNSELTVYAGVGHMPQLEVPGRLSEDMRAFLLR
jgi:pimeloyl-ACP methyl ester carboxylesterase